MVELPEKKQQPADQTSKRAIREESRGIFGSVRVVSLLSQSKKVAASLIVCVVNQVQRKIIGAEVL